MRLLEMSELKSVKGVPFSRQHLHRLISAGQFPRPIKVGLNRNAFLEEEVDAWLQARIAERDRAMEAA